MVIQKRRIVADEEIEVKEEVEVHPEATDMLFEAEDVAELLAEVTGEAVEVTVDDSGDAVTFAVGEDEYLVEAEGGEEVLEAVRRPLRNKRTVSASKKFRGSARKPSARKVNYKK